MKSKKKLSQFVSFKTNCYINLALNFLEAIGAKVLYTKYLLQKILIAIYYKK